MGTLNLGIPKGSLQERTLELFKKAGFNISISSRSYFPAIDDSEIKVFMVRAQELSRYVEEGAIDCGITGYDWILDNCSDVLILDELVYAKRTNRPVRWVVAVKDDSSIVNIKDLEGKKIATELYNYTKRFFEKENIKVDIEFSWGATEVKVKSGLVDAIVELTETGESLRANGLRELATICVSTTKFIANKNSYKNRWKKQKIDCIRMLLKGALEAEGKVGLKLNVNSKNLNNVIKILPALKKPTISPLTLKNWFALEIIVEEKQVRELIPKLKENGAEGIIEYPLNKLIH
ncbi:MAG: ATP phosphoribosyltransferase [Candidatus Omnitrophica bacterium]|nr:ATP phosphoribosyltransferase [Candidatus Omnitrophota bacterium]MCM8826201.1 ATP phosphoribosyltransferase [Candidatus Omnitrophota bacterium]